MGDGIIYAVIIAGLLVLGYGIFGMPTQRGEWQAQGISAGVGGAGSGGNVQLQGSLPAECGDINDVKNLQHLSHHPDQFQECYKFVDAGKFQQAVGQPLSDFMGQGNSQQDSMAGHHG